MKFFQVRIAFFSNTMPPRNMKFGLNIHFSIRIFLKYCETKEHEIWPKYSLLYILYKNVLDDQRIGKNIAL